MISFKKFTFIILYAVIFIVIIASGYSIIKANNYNLSNKKEIGYLPTGIYTINWRTLYLKTEGTDEGHQIFKSTLHINIKSSWSKISNKITFLQVPIRDSLFRDYRKWTPAICTINIDGSNFKKLTSGNFGDFNPTWLRNTEEIIFSRLNQSTGHWSIYLTRSDCYPGQEILISDPNYNEVSVTTLNDGRLLIESEREKNSDFFLFQIDRDNQKKPTGNPGKYQNLIVNVPKNMKHKHLVRPTVSPDNTKIAFELADDPWDMKNTIIYFADFDTNSQYPEISNFFPIVPVSKSYSSIYPKWSNDGNSIIFTSNQTGKYQFYQYYIINEETRRISTRDDSDYTYFCAQNTPN